MDYNASITCHWSFWFKHALIYYKIPSKGLIIPNQTVGAGHFTGTAATSSGEKSLLHRKFQRMTCSTSATIFNLTTIKIILYHISGVRTLLLIYINMCVTLARSYLHERLPRQLLTNVTAFAGRLTVSWDNGKMQYCFCTSMPCINPQTRCVLFILLAIQQLASDSDINNVHATVNRELVEVNNRLKTNRLSLNVSKTSYMIISNQKNAFVNKIRESILMKVSTVKFFGVTLDENLTFNDHVNKVTSKISKSVGVMRRLHCQLPG